MLPTTVGLLNGTPLGGGNYTVDIFFQDGSKAKFLRVGDTVEDSIGNQYQVTTWSLFPSDFVPAGQVTVSFITTDTVPATSAGFDSSVFTPGQVDVRPAIKTSGTIFSAGVFSGQDFEYTVTASWADGFQAANAIVGDNITDFEGKEYEITFLDTGRFSDPFRCKEVVAEGQAPSVGTASLYRNTINFGFFQGSPISDPARTVIRNRDDFNIDAFLKNLQDQIDVLSSGGAGGASVEMSMVNNSGSSINARTPVRVNATGGVSPVDPSIEDEAFAIVGITKAFASNGSSVDIVTSGRLENIVTSATFDDRVYLSSTGGITEVKPDLGVGGFVAGDFVISLGVIAENQTTPGNRDLIINVELIGQL
jgi:hypothetical protein